MTTATPDGPRVVKPFWSPLVAGVALGMVLLLTFVVSGHGLGASGAATLGIAAFVFLGLFFTVGLIVSRLVRGV